MTDDAVLMTSSEPLLEKGQFSTGGDGSPPFPGNHSSRFSYFLSAHASSRHVGPTEALTSGAGLGLQGCLGQKATSSSLRRGPALSWDGFQENCSVLARLHTGCRDTVLQDAIRFRLPGRTWRDTPALSATHQPQHGDVRGHATSALRNSKRLKEGVTVHLFSSDIGIGRQKSGENHSRSRQQ